MPEPIARSLISPAHPTLTHAALPAAHRASPVARPISKTGPRPRRSGNATAAAAGDTAACALANCVTPFGGGPRLAFGLVAMRVQGLEGARREGALEGDGEDLAAHTHTHRAPPRPTSTPRSPTQSALPPRTPIAMRTTPCRQVSPATHKVVERIAERGCVKREPLC